MSGWSAVRFTLLIALLLSAHPLTRLSAQSRLWRPEDRVFISDLSVVTALAATRQVVYAATFGGLAVYDRAFGTWQETVGPLDGLPPLVITAMAADPSDDTAWMGADGHWLSWQPFTRRLESGTLPGAVRQVLLDAGNPSGGAYFGTTAGWFFVQRGSIVAVRSSPPSSRLPGAIGQDELRRVLPAFDAIRSRIETDELLRRFRLTAATRVPQETEVFVGTEGNGTFRVDAVSHAVTRLSAGIAGGMVTAIASTRGWTCAGTSLRAGRGRTAVTCFDETLRDPLVIEDPRTLNLTGTRVQRLLVTERAVWIATDRGLIRATRARGRLDVLTTADGLPASDVLSLAASATGAWVGTARGLVHVTDSGRVLDVARIVGARTVHALAMAGDHLFVGSPFGLSVLPPLATELPSAGAAFASPVVAVATRGTEAAVLLPRELFLLEVPALTRTPVPVHGIGELTGVAADETGYWVAGTEGFAFVNRAEPDVRTWIAADVPGPIRDITVSQGYLWVATDAGVVRFDKRVLRR